MTYMHCGIEQFSPYMNNFDHSVANWLVRETIVHQNKSRRLYFKLRELLLLLLLDPYLSKVRPKSSNPIIRLELFLCDLGDTNYKSRFSWLIKSFVKMAGNLNKKKQ